MQNVRKIVLRKEHPDVSVDILTFRFYESDRFCSVVCPSFLKLTF